MTSWLTEKELWLAVRWDENWVRMLVTVREKWLVVCWEQCWVSAREVEKANRLVVHLAVC